MMFFVWYVSQYLHLHETNDKNLIFKYNSNAKYLNRDLKGGHTGNDFPVKYLNEKGPSVKIQ